MIAEDFRDKLEKYGGVVTLELMPQAYVKYPTYCRNSADKVRWLAYHLGYTKSISPKHVVIYVPEKERYTLVINPI